MKLFASLGSEVGIMASVRRTWLLMLLAMAAASLSAKREARASAICVQEGRPCDPQLAFPCCNPQTVCGMGDTGVFSCNAVE
jgi:hypothetical protein